MNFSIIVAGLNHKVASVDIREKYSLSEFTSPEKWAFRNLDGLKENLILATCNRVEVLGIGTVNFRDALLANWIKTTGGSEKELRHHLYVYENSEAIRHVFEVASSLDSMVLGEPQILGQFKDAYRKSILSGNAGPVLNRLMHAAFYISKRVRNETSIGANAVSISYAAVELAKCIFGNLQKHSALLLGAGEMAELAALHLQQAGILNLSIANRTHEKAKILAKKYKATPVLFETLEKHLQSADIVISSTASTEPVITRAMLNPIMRARKNRPIFFIDIAVPRDIDPDVNEMDNIYLYDIDDLREVVEKNRLARQKEAAAAKAIIENETVYFEKWLENLKLRPTILDLLNKGEEAAEIEVKKTMHKLGTNSPEVRLALERMAKSLVNRLNHAPLAWLKNQNDSEEEMKERINTIRKIFSLDNFDNSTHN